MIPKRVVPFYTLALVSVLSGAVAFVAADLRAQQAPKADAEYLRSAYDTYRAMTQASPYRGIPWQPLGPTNISGRATDVAVSGGRQATHLRRRMRRAACGRPTTTARPGRRCSKTTPRPASATSRSPRRIPTSSGWVPASRTCSGHRWPGVGVYKSTDGGRTFTHAGLTDTQTISRIVVHPANPDIVYVAPRATSGPTTRCAACSRRPTAGKTWSKVLYRSPRTGRHRSRDGSLGSRVRSTPRRGSGCGGSGAIRARSRVTARAASGRRPTPGRRGSRPTRACRRHASAGGLDSTSRVESQRRVRVASTITRRDVRRATASGMPILARLSRAGSRRPRSTAPTTKDRTWRKVSASDDFMMRHSGTYGWVFGQIRVDPPTRTPSIRWGWPQRVSRCR